MSGTDHSQTPGPASTPAIILVRPQMGENIGAAARAMWNFALDRMRIVAPRDGWPNPAAVAMASGAARVLDNVIVTETVEEAQADLHFVYATTARVREFTKPVMTPEEAMGDARARVAAGQKVGVLFGPERAGLENADLAGANALISVPVNPAFGSLNLAQCVLLVAYEWLRQGDALPPEDMATPATQIEMEKLYEHFETALTASHFFFPETKAPHMKANLRNLLSRMPLTDADVRILHGVLRALKRKD